MMSIKREVDIMKKCRWKNGKGRGKYVPICTNPSKKKKKKSDFVSKGKSDELNKEGINLEKSSIKQKNILYSIGILASIALLFADIRDDGMFVDCFGIKFSGSMVGTLIFISCILGVYKNKSKINIE